MSQKLFISISYILLFVFLGFGLIEQSCAAWSGKLDISPKGGSSWVINQTEESKDKNESRDTIKIESGSGMTEEAPLQAEADLKEEKKIKQDINTYIIDSYKVQGTKIVKDLSTKLNKTISDPKDRQEAYRKIRSSLELRLEKTERLKMSETKKLILQEFLTHMIDLLGMKIEELK
jgi:hypothetical protein